MQKAATVHGSCSCRSARAQSTVHKQLRGPHMASGLRVLGRPRLALLPHVLQHGQVLPAQARQVEQAGIAWHNEAMTPAFRVHVMQCENTVVMRHLQ
jgi:hypothetical protein